MLEPTVFMRGCWTEFLYLNRAKFAVLVVNGISVPFSATE